MQNTIVAKPPKISTEKPKVSKEKAIAALRDVVTVLDACGGVASAADPRFKAWLESARSTYRNVFGEESDELIALLQVNFSSPYLGPAGYGGDAFGEWEAPVRHDDLSYFQSGVQEARNVVEVHVRQIERFWPDEPTNPVTERSALDIVVMICDRFHLAARRLRNRRHPRPPLIMADEHDVQYLLGAILDIHFDDIVPENVVPTYAGGASRIDFVLRGERIAIETKRTRTNLTEKEVGEELIVDIARYQTHPGVDALICLVHDPDNLIQNPRGLEQDLVNTPSGRLEVRALVRPR
jgi:hypothetical protein